MRAAIFLFVFQNVFWHAGAAQRKWRDTIPTQSLSVRFNPLGLVDLIDQNLSTGIEYRFNRRWSATMDVAWVFNSSDFNASGLLIRPAARYFVGYRKRQFLELEFHYKHVNRSIKDWLGHDCVNAVPAYEQYENFNLIKRAVGLHFKTGAIFPIERSRFAIEVYAGFGVHIRSHHIAHQPNCCYLQSTDVFPNLDNEQLPALPLGARLLYRVH